jgi:hypothetical protein
MSREYPMFGLRMPPELKDKVSREAKINGRSLNAEIVDRLRKSLEPLLLTESGHKVAQMNSSYMPELTDIERKLLTIFRRLPVEKQLALLSLFN